MIAFLAGCVTGVLGMAGLGWLIADQVEHERLMQQVGSGQLDYRDFERPQAAPKKPWTPPRIEPVVIPTGPPGGSPRPEGLPVRLLPLPEADSLDAEAVARETRARRRRFGPTSEKP